MVTEKHEMMGSEQGMISVCNVELTKVRTKLKHIMPMVA